MAYHNQASRDVDQDGRIDVASGLVFPPSSHMPDFFRGNITPAYYNQAQRDVDQGIHSSPIYSLSLHSSSIYSPIYSIDEVVTDDELIRSAYYEGDSRRVEELLALHDDSILPEMDEVVTDDEYFTRADLDEDGRICKAEGLAFFQGSNLPKYTIDEIWRIADNKQEGLLEREEFKNALKLVSLVQRRLERGEDVILSVEKETLLSLGRANNNIPAPVIKIVTPDQHLKWLKIWATHPAVKAGVKTHLWHRRAMIYVFPNGDMRFPPNHYRRATPPPWTLTTESSSAPPPPPADSS